MEVSFELIEQFLDRYSNRSHFRLRYGSKDFLPEPEPDIPKKSLNKRRPNGNQKVKDPVFMATVDEAIQSKSPCDDFESPNHDLL